MEPCSNCGSIHERQGVCPGLQAGLPGKAFGDHHAISAGKVLQGRYEILHMLGQGGMGTVYMARDLRLKGRSCVVKKLRDDFYRDEDRQKAQEFFQREMEVLAELEHHNNIVRLLDYFPESGDFFLVMEYVQGNNLHYMLHEERRGQPFPEETVIEWSKQICDVLNYLHEQDPPIIYRDLKPSNVMIDIKNEVKLVDFGIARRAQSGENTHVISAGYSPPEQYWGSADVRSDVYSLGATMQFLLTGKDPEALHVSSPRASNPDVSEALDKIVQQATAQDLNERFQTAREFWEALLHVDCEQAPQTPRSRWHEAVAGILVLVGAALIMQITQLPQADNNSSSATKAGKQTLSAEEDLTHAQSPRAKQPTAVSHDSAHSGLKHTGEASPSHAELAVQDMDERDLTDPSGLPDNISSIPDQEKQKSKKAGSLFEKLFGKK